MHLRAPAILLAARPHGETAVIARLLTAESGVVAVYVAGGRGRQLRPVVIPGNLVAADIRAKSDSQMPFARLELAQSRGPWLSEPLPAATIAWVCALTASVLPERNAYPNIYLALAALLDAICNAPSARGWVPALASYEILVLRELGYGGQIDRPGTMDQSMSVLRMTGSAIGRYLLSDTRADVLASRTLLMRRLQKLAA